MESSLGIQLLLAATGVVPAIFFHLQDRGFLLSSVLSAMTSGWTVALLLVFHSGLPWGLALLGGISWIPAFSVVAAVVGIPVRLARKAAELRMNERSNVQECAGSTREDLAHTTMTQEEPQTPPDDGRA